jgi:hypothetical protein
MFILFPPPLGTRICDRYELLAPLRGDHAVVTYLALDEHTGQRHALTLFDPTRAQADLWAEYARLVSVAAAAKLPGLMLPPQVPATPPDPPHVVDDPPVKRGLDRLCAQEGRIPWQRALALGERLAAILHGVYAATAVAHRALTPSRCTIGVNDEVEVLDYGVAEIELAGDEPEEAEYRAPEQRGGKGDIRSDVFSLAAILYELLSGTRPSAAPPRLSSLVSVPPAVERVLDQSLAVDPAERPANLEAMRAALREALDLTQAPSNKRTAPPDSTPLPRTPARPHTKSSALHQLDPLPLIPPVKPSPSPRTPHPADLQAERTERFLKAPIQRDTTLILSRSDASPPERTELLPTPPTQHDTTLALPNSDDLKSQRPPPRARPTPSSHISDERTEVFQKSPNHRAPIKKSTQSVSKNPHQTKIFSTPPRRSPSPLPDRTEVLAPQSSTDTPPLASTELITSPLLSATASLPSDDTPTLSTSQTISIPNKNTLEHSRDATTLTEHPSNSALPEAEISQTQQECPPSTPEPPHCISTAHTRQHTTSHPTSILLIIAILLGAVTWAALSFI